MTAVLLPNGKQQYFTTAGLPAVGYKIATFDAGTSNPRTTWQDSGKVATNTNPVILDARGEASIFWEGAYKVQLQDSTGAVIWTQDNLQSQQNGFSASLVPAVTNTIDLGSASLSWRNLYLGANNAPVLGASGNIGYYKKTAAETTLGVTPTDFSYPADPYVDPRRYGAKGDWNGTTGTDDTAAWQTALNVAYSSNGRVMAPANFISLVGALSVTMTAGKSLIISGQSPTSTLLHAKAGLAATSLLTFTTGNPATTQISAYLKLENFGIDGSSITVGVHGLSLLGIGAFQISNVRIAKFDRGIDLQSALIGTIDSGTECTVNNTGMRIVAASSATTSNLIRVYDSRFNTNTKIGIDFNGGSELQLRSVDVEGNGAAGDISTGGVFIRGQIGPDSLEASVIVDGCWFESNGGISLFMEANTVGASTVLAVRGGQILAADSGRALYVFGCTRLSVEDIQCTSPGDTFNLTATNAFMKNVIVSTLTDTGVTTPWYLNVSTSTTQHINGRLDPGLAVSMTGCVASPIAGTLDAVLQGNRVVLRFAAISGTSNSVNCTIGTLPAKYRPIATRLILVAVVNNGVDEVHGATVSTGGVIDLDVFAAAGTKGIRLCQGEYVL